MAQEIIVYYDNEPSIGVNATCEDWPQRNEYFSSMPELLNYLAYEYVSDYYNLQLVEITSQNYEELCAKGVFYAE